MPVLTAAVIADIWEMVTTLGCYGHAPGTVGWWRGNTYVLLWDFRTGNNRWRQLPVPRPRQPPKQSSWIFQSSPFLRELERR